MVKIQLANCLIRLGLIIIKTWVGFVNSRNMFYNFAIKNVSQCFQKSALFDPLLKMSSDFMFTMTSGPSHVFLITSIILSELR